MKTKFYPIAPLLASVLILFAGCTYDPAGYSDKDLFAASNSNIEKQTQWWYYSNGEKIYSDVVKDKIFIMFVYGTDRKTAAAIAGCDNPFDIITNPEGRDYTSAELEAIRNHEEVEYVSYLFGQWGVVSNGINVKLKDAGTYGQFAEYASHYGCKITDMSDEGVDVFKNVYRLTVPKSLGSIQVANAFFETGLFEYSSPDFFAIAY